MAGTTVLRQILEIGAGNSASPDLSGGGRGATRVPTGIHGPEAIAIGPRQAEGQ